MEQPHEPLVVPAEAHIAADAAIVHDPEAGHQRHAAAEDQLVPAPLPQQLHGPAHSGGPGLPLVSKGGHGIEEIQLHKIKMPRVKDPFKNPPEIVLHLGIVDIQRIEAAPIAAAVPALPIGFQQPVRVLPVDFRLCLAHEGGQPQPSQQAALMAPLYKGSEAIREFLRVRFHPVSHKGFPAVVNLE